MTISQTFARRAALLVAGVLALGIVVTVEWMQDHESAAPPEVAPAGALLKFTLKNMNGLDVRLDSFKGKVVLVNFWATWCGPCRTEIPDLIELQSVVVMHRFGTHVKQFASEFQINYPVLDATGRTDVEDAYGPMWGLPTTILIDRGGNVATQRSGIGSKEQFERDVKPLL